MRWLAMAVIMAWAIPVHAQAPTPSPAPVLSPAAEFDRGERLFAEGKYAEALRAFRKAFELEPHDVIRFNIGVCLERLGQLRDALAEYEVVAKSEEISPKDKDRAAANANAVRAQLGTLLINRPRGTSVKVTEDVSCSAPCNLWIEPGSYDLVIDGVERVSVVVARGQTAVVEPTVAPDAAPSATVDPEPLERSSYQPTWLTWVGLGVAAIGIGGTIGFGVRTLDVLDDYEAMPTRQALDDGRLLRGLTNGAIVVASVGAAAMFVDLVFIAP